MSSRSGGYIVRIRARLSMSISSFMRLVIQLDLLLMPIGVRKEIQAPSDSARPGRRSRTEQFCLQKHMHLSRRLDSEHLLTCKSDANEVQYLELGTAVSNG